MHIGIQVLLAAIRHLEDEYQKANHYAPGCVTLPHVFIANEDARNLLVERIADIVIERR